MSDLQRELFGYPKKQQGSINVLSLLASTIPKKSLPPEPVKSKPIEEQHELFKMPEDHNKKKLKNIVQEARMTPQQLKFKKNMEALKQRQKKAPKTSSGPNFISMRALEEEKLQKVSQKSYSIKKPQKTGAIKQETGRKTQKQKQRIQISKQKEKKKQLQKHKDLNQKERERQKERYKEKQRQKRKEFQKRKLKKQRQQNQRQRSRQKQKKKNRYSDSQQEDDLDDFIVDSAQDGPDWRKQIRKVTGRDFRDPKYRKLDKEKIVQQTSSNRIFAQERYSAYVGKKDEEQDWKKQMQLLKKKKNKD